jgi:integrase
MDALLKKASKMLLKEVLDSLVLARKLSPLTVANYRRAIIYFSNHIGDNAKVSDLTLQRVNSWLSSSESDYNPRYVKSLRRDLLVVWNHAADLELIAHPKTRLIRRPQCEIKPPTAWPAYWIPRLLEACEKLPGKIKRYPMERSVYCEAYLRVQLDLLCRPTDMRFLRWSQLDGDGTITWSQHKTGHLVKRKLSRPAFAAVNRLKGVDRDYLFPLSKSANERLIARIFQAAGITKPVGESLGHLRHTGGTMIAAREDNDTARRALGHTEDSRVFEKFYLDTTQIPPVESSVWWENS